MEISNVIPVSFGFFIYTNTSLQTGARAGGSSTRIVWVKNSGDAHVFLILDTENWAPPTAENYLSVDWDYDGSAIAPGSIRQIVITLSASPTIQGIDSFYFDIVFVASVQ